ncbi:MAG TPA: nucleotidyltransferase family protein [Planctomycetota bacterium]|nr:nucleotidyltransferase family protein [Planctomycetota bacterium]
MATTTFDGRLLLNRMADAVESVQERLLRATGALNAAGVPYAVVGGNAVAVWVATVDKAAVRNTQDVDILIRRNDLLAVKAALEAAGFTYRHVGKLDIFLDGANAKMRDSVHIIFAGEKVREHESFSNPDVTESVAATPFRFLSLEALVRIKLTAFRDKDRTHLRDLLDVGLIDATWLKRLPAELTERLKLLIETPEG